jgi:hypothetical protein
MSKVVTRPETITPDTAKKYLEKNTRNRPLMETTVDRYARMMKQGHWLLTHQGIAFSEAGDLLDGQHRLAAIARCGVPVSILVSRGLPAGQENGISINAMDVIDCGKGRTVANQLFLSHGVANANLTAAACKCIGMICLGTTKVVITTPQALSILNIYGASIESVIPAVSGLKPARKSGIVGALAFARITHREVVDEFACRVSSGESLKRGDSAFAFRQWLINGGHYLNGGSVMQEHEIEAALNCLLNTINGVPVLQIKRGDAGRKFFSAKQRGNVEKVRTQLGY